MFADLAARLRPSSVQVRDGGSGVIWNSDGLILTNAHVVRSGRAQVVLHDGRRLDAQLVARNPERDLAALRVDAKRLPSVHIGDSSRLRVGQIVVAIGNPLGVVGAVTTGIVHAIGPLRLRRHEWIQADVRLAPGNSGGMLADAEGNVIGINTMIYGGLGLAVPSNAVADFLAGDAPRLGVTVRNVATGLLILEIERGSIADQAGLLLGDVLLTTSSGLSQTMREAQKAGAVLRYVRGGNTRQIVIQPKAGARAA